MVQGIGPGVMGDFMSAAFLAWVRLVFRGIGLCSMSASRQDAVPSFLHAASTLSCKSDIVNTGA